MKLNSKPGLLKLLFGGGRHSIAARPKLPLYIPVAPKSGKGPSTDVDALVEDFLQHNYAPVSSCIEMTRLLKKINPLPLSADQRVRLTNILLNEMNNALGAVFPRFLEQGSGVPETREQREGLSHSARAVELLAISYKLAFQDDYAEADDEPARRERLITVTLRIMELIRIEQLVRAFRYQPLPQHVWRDCNQLFFAALSFADARAAHPLKLRVFNSLALPPRGLFPELGSLEQVYLSVQVIGLLDVISWPTHLMYVVDNYIAELDPPLRIQRDHDEELPPGQVVIYRNQGVPPRFKLNPDELGDAVRVDLTPLSTRAAADRRALAAAPGAAALSHPLRQVPEQERVPIIDLLFHKISPQHRREPRRTVLQPRDARVYGGFDSVYRYLRSQAVPEKSGNAHFFHSLALQPQMLAGYGDRSPPRWIVANESEGGIQFRIRETQYSMPLHVGRLMTYTLGDDEHAKLGYVTRLERVGEDEVEVAIARLRERATAVVVEELESNQQRASPALLVHGPGGGLQLLCQHKQGMAAGKHVAIVENGHSRAAVIGEVSLNKPEFVLFKLHTE